MSQDAPPPPGSVPPQIPTAHYARPGAAGPPGYPPYTPEPLGYGDYNLSARSRTSGMAIASFVLGLLGCVPIITGIAAIVLGIFGIRVTRKPEVKGKALAIIGVCLRALSLLGWGVIGYVWYAAFWPQHVLVDTFFTDLSSGDIAGAQKLCGPTVTAAQLETVASELKGWGTATNTAWSANTNTTTGSTIDETRNYSIGGVQTFHFNVSRNGNGQWQIDSFMSSTVVTMTYPSTYPTTLPTSAP